MRVYLFGFLDDDFFGRVVVTPTEQTVATLAAQLAAWGPTPGQDRPVSVTDESGVVLDPAATVAEAGPGNGDIFTVTGGR